MANSAFTPTNLGTGTSSGASGSGINYLSSHFAADSLGSVTLNVGDTLSSSTRSNPTQWGTSAASAIIAQSSDSTLRGTTNYLVAYTANAQFIESPLFTLDGSDLGKPLLVQFDVSGVGTSDDVQCYVVRYNSSNVLQERIVIAGTASATTPFSARVQTGTGQFRGFFIPGSTASDKYAIRWLRNANNTSMRLDSFVVGPQSIITDAAMTDWVEDTSGIFTLNAFGTISNKKFFWRRVGDSMQIRGTFQSGTVTASTASFQLSSAYTIDSTKFGTVANVQKVGFSEWLTTASATLISPYSNAYIHDIFYDGSTTDRLFFGQTINNANFRKCQGNEITTTGAYVGFEATIPISQWSSNVTQAERAVEEYAWNSSTTDATDTSSFSSGPGGVQFGNFTAARAKRIQFSTPIQPTDALIFEFTLNGGTTWFPLGTGNTDYLSIRENRNGISYGVQLDVVSSTQVNVNFGQYATSAGATTFGGAGQTYAGIAGNNTYKWRVRKVSGGAAVGYPVSSANVVGRTDGASVASGYIGQKIDGTLNTVAYSGITNIGSISLTPGVWMIYGSGMFTWSTLTTFNYYKVGISTANNSFSGQIHEIATSGTTLTDIPTIPAPPTYANVSSTTTYYLNGQLSATGTSLQSINTSMYLYAIRIA